MIRAVFLKGEAAFQVDGEDFTIVLDAGAWMLAEQAAGFSLIQLLARIHAALESDNEPMVADLGAILHAGLSKHHGDLTFEDALNLLLSDYTRVSAALNEAIVASLPGSQAEAGNAPAPVRGQTKPGNGTGKGLSRSGAGRDNGSKTSSTQPPA